MLKAPLNIHVRVAARGVAVLSPTPTPFSTARVASMVVMEEQNAWRNVIPGHLCLSTSLTTHLQCVPQLVLQVVTADSIRVALWQKSLLCCKAA